MINLYGDDSIIRLKEKILKECRGLNSSTREMYLFSLKQTKLNAIVSYNKLTQNDNLDLNEDRLKHLWNFIENKTDLQNKTNFNGSNIKKDIYTYDDILNLNVDWNETYNTSNRTKTCN